MMTKDELLTELMSIVVDNIDDQEELLHEFYYIYFRSPRKDEFESFGGNLVHVELVYGSYSKFLEHFGYPKVTNGETYEVLENKRGDREVIFTGTFADIAEEFDTVKTSVSRAYKEGRPFKHKKYILRHKPFVAKGR